MCSGCFVSKIGQGNPKGKVKSFIFPVESGCELLLGLSWEIPEYWD